MFRIKLVEENQNTHFVFNIFFPPENLTVYEIRNMEKYCRTARPQIINGAFALRAGKLTLQADTQNMLSHCNSF